MREMERPSEEDGRTVPNNLLQAKRKPAIVALRDNAVSENGRDNEFRGAYATEEASERRSKSAASRALRTDVLEKGLNIYITVVHSIRTREA